MANIKNIVGRILDMEGNVIREGMEAVAENIEKNAEKTTKNLSKKVEKNIVENLSNKGARESANVFKELGGNKFERAMDAADNDLSKARRIIRNQDKAATRGLPKFKSAKESAKVFEETSFKPGVNGGVKIGDTNPIYVKAGGDIDTFYKANVKMGKNRDDAVTKAFKDIGDEAIIEDMYNTPGYRNKTPLDRGETRQKFKDNINSQNATGSGNKANRRAETLHLEEGKIAREAEEKAKSGLKGNTPVSTPKHKELKNNRYNSLEDYMKFSTSKEYEEINAAFKKKEFNNPLLEKYGIDKNTSLEELQSLRNEAINGIKREDAGLTDHLGYHKVPQKVTGVMSTMWLVNKMAGTKGEQTNSQLYGQTLY